ncbi:hypothetical protein ACROYT_G023800 [Oculina patagonica]
MFLTVICTIVVAPLLIVFIYWLMQNGKSWKVTSFFQTATLRLEMALREYDDFLILHLFQHQKIVSAVKCFGVDTAKPCVLIGSAFEGCYLPKNLNSEKGSAVEFDFFVCLPTPVAGESAGTLQYMPLDGRPHQVLLKLSDLSIIESEYIGLKSPPSNLRGSFLKKCQDGFYLKRNLMEAFEEKIQNSLGKVLVEKPGGMEIVSRSDLGCYVGLQASQHVSFFKPITERLEMLPLDPDTWSGDAMTNAQMLWVNLTNWSSSLWPTRIFNVHLALECEWPADAIMNWLQRERFWPSERTVQIVAQSSCYLHPLWCQEKGRLSIDSEVMAFQMTFSVAECLLFTETGPKERMRVVVRNLYFMRKRSSQVLQLERALFKYDNFLLLNMVQHKLIFEAIKEQRILRQLQRCVLPVGSMFEGCHIAECPSGGQISQEMDFMLILPDITATAGDSEALQFASVEGPNPGMFERRVEYAVSHVMGTKFTRTQGLELGMKRKNINDFYPVMTIFFKEPINCLIWPESTAWPDSALGALFDTLSVIQGSQDTTAWQNQIIDIAPAIQSDVPAHVKDTWLKRRRYWPDQGLVEKISSLPCYLLAKPHSLTTNKLLEWRFSFSSAELLLSSAIKPWQKQTLMVLKALRRKYLQEPKVVASYHLKTVLFWVLESLPDQIRESCCRAALLQMLLDKLISCVKERNLPHYFIPENNMFSHYEDDDLNTVLLKVQDMQKNLLLYLTEDLFTTAVTEEREEKEFQETYWGVI